jgi:hypothetical protein
MRKAVAGVVMLCLLVWAGVAFAKSKKKPKEKYFVNLAAVEATDKVPAEIPGQIKTKLTEVLAKRAEFIPALDGAPDPVADGEAFKKWLKKSKVRAFKVTVKVTDYERELLPAKEGKTGQILKVHVAVSLVGTAMPDDVLTLGGDGMATVATEIGKTVRPADDKFAIDSAMSEALGQAVEDAVQALNAGPKAKPAKK